MKKHPILSALAHGTAALALLAAACSDDDDDDDDDTDPQGVCGNGVVEFGETCDGDSQPCTGDSGYMGLNACDINCGGRVGCIVIQNCGDGVLNGPESCDDGPGGECLDDCSAVNECGDGIVFVTETCDDGNNDDCDECHNDCTANADSCGDGHICGVEACDDGDNDNCTPECAFDCSGPYPLAVDLGQEVVFEDAGLEAAVRNNLEIGVEFPIKTGDMCRLV